MRLTSKAFTSFLGLATGAALALGAFTTQAADATGTWSWTTQGRQGGGGGGGGGGEPRKTTLTLKQEGEKLTGKLASPGRQGGEGRTTEISEGKVKGDEVSFVVKREFNNNTMSQKFTGKLSGDTIKGKMEFDRGGESQSRDWEAKREAAKKE